MAMNTASYEEILDELEKSANECRFNKMNVFSRLRLMLMIVYLLVMNSKRFIMGEHVRVKSLCMQMEVQKFEH